MKPNETFVNHSWNILGQSTHGTHFLGWKHRLTTFFPHNPSSAFVWGIIVSQMSRSVLYKMWTQNFHISPKRYSVHCSTGTSIPAFCFENVRLRMIQKTWSWCINFDMSFHTYSDREMSVTMVRFAWIRRVALQVLHNTQKDCCFTYMLTFPALPRRNLCFMAKAREMVVPRQAARRLFPFYRLLDLFHLLFSVFVSPRFRIHVSKRYCRRLVGPLFLILSIIQYLNHHHRVYTWHFHNATQSVPFSVSAGTQRVCMLKIPVFALVFLVSRCIFSIFIKIPIIYSSMYSPLFFQVFSNGKVMIQELFCLNEHFRKKPGLGRVPENKYVNLNLWKQIFFPMFSSVMYTTE